MAREDRQFRAICKGGLCQRHRGRRRFRGQDAGRLSRLDHRCSRRRALPNLEFHLDTNSIGGARTGKARSFCRIPPLGPNEWTRSPRQLVLRAPSGFGNRKRTKRDRSHPGTTRRYGEHAFNEFAIRSTGFHSLLLRFRCRAAGAGRGVRGWGAACSSLRRFGCCYARRDIVAV